MVRAWREQAFLSVCNVLSHASNMGWCSVLISSAKKRGRWFVGRIDLMDLVTDTEEATNEKAIAEKIATERAASEKPATDAKKL